MKLTLLNCQTGKIRVLTVPDGTIPLLQQFEIVILKESL